MAKILLMEDEADQATMLHAILTNAGHDVTVAYNGDEAWVLLSNQPYDVLVTDMNVKSSSTGPRHMGGLGLISRMRVAKSLNAPDWLPKVRIVAISGVYDIKDDLLKMAVNVGADICLRKPVSIDRIVQAVNYRYLDDCRSSHL